MKKIAIALTVTLSLGALIATTIYGKEPSSLMRPMPSQITIPFASGSGVLQSREKELLKRENKVNNTASNSAEAKRQFQEKMNAARKARLECLKTRAADIRNLEVASRASGSASLSICSPKALEVSYPRPSRPILDGLSAADKQAAMTTYQATLKEYYVQVQTAMKACKDAAAQARLDIREKIIAIKEECSATERTVLGLSTEIPYNAQ